MKLLFQGIRNSYLNNCVMKLQLPNLMPNVCTQIESKNESLQRITQKEKMGDLSLLANSLRRPCK